MQGPTCGLSQQAAEAGGSLTQETLGKGGSSLDNAGTGQHCQMARVRQARRRGVRMQEPVVEPPQEVRTGSNLVDRAGIAVRCDLFTTEGGTASAPWSAPGATVKCLRRSRGQACRGKAGRLSRRTVSGERGNRPRVASLPARQAGSGKARRLLMSRGRGGGSRSSPRPGEPATWRRDPASSQWRNWNVRRTLVNTDAPWPDLDEAEWRVLKIQTKLHQWAIDDPRSSVR